MKRVSQSEISKNNTADVEEDTAVKDMEIMSARIQTLEKLVAQMVQYQKDHDELHRNMATMHGKKTAELEKAVALAITENQQDMREGSAAQSAQLQQVIITVQKAIEEFSGKKIEVNLPEPPVTELVDYEIQYGQTGKIVRIKETKA